jgi:deoxyribodipyrimidine photo-lyase
MKQLVDLDIASNNGGWQWAAGTGTDASPFFRIFNPVTQGRKFDPKGEFIKSCIPELVGLPQKFIHEPWKMNREQQEKTGCIIGKNYPFPIVDHLKERKIALDLYNSRKK